MDSGTQKVYSTFVTYPTMSQACIPTRARYLRNFYMQVHQLFQYDRVRTIYVQDSARVTDYASSEWPKLYGGGGDYLLIFRSVDIAE